MSVNNIVRALDSCQGFFQEGEGIFAPPLKFFCPPPKVNWHPKKCLAPLKSFQIVLLLKRKPGCSMVLGLHLKGVACSACPLDRILPPAPLGKRALMSCAYSFVNSQFLIEGLHECLSVTCPCMLGQLDIVITVYVCV